MSRLAPKPIIARVVQTWDVPPGMKIALVEDVERCVWIVESCPVGTHFWTSAQAQELPQTGRTGYALRAAISAARALEATRAGHLTAPSLPAMPLRETFSPRETQEAVNRESLTRSPSLVRPLRRSTRRDKMAVCA